MNLERSDIIAALLIAGRLRQQERIAKRDAHYGGVMETIRRSIAPRLGWRECYVAGRIPRRELARFLQELDEICAVANLRYWELRAVDSLDDGNAIYRAVRHAMSAWYRAASDDATGRKRRAPMTEQELVQRQRDDMERLDDELDDILSEVYL